MSDWIRLPGNTEAEVEVMLFARAPGLLKDFTLDVGDRVKPGQTIAHIDAPDLEQDIKLGGIAARIRQGRAGFRASAGGTRQDSRR